MRKSLILITCSLALSGCSEKIPDEAKAVSDILSELDAGFEIGLNQNSFAEKIIRLSTSIKKLEKSECKEKCQLALKASLHSLEMSANLLSYWKAKRVCIRERTDFWDGLDDSFNYDDFDRWCDKFTFIPLTNWDQLSKKDREIVMAARDRGYQVMSDFLEYKLTSEQLKTYPIPKEGSGAGVFKTYMKLQYSYRDSAKFYDELYANGNSAGLLASAILTPDTDFKDDEVVEVKVSKGIISGIDIYHQNSLSREISKTASTYDVFDKILSGEPQ